MTVNDVFILPVTKSVLNKTVTNVIRKYSNTKIGLMYNRTPVELLDNIFMGDLAKNALFEYLSNHCRSKIIDYDEIRTDNFLDSDPGWDFLVGAKSIKVEVKSSIPPNNESHESIIKNRDIKITASHDNGKTLILPEKLESEIHVQIYFYATTYKRGYDSFQKLQKILNTDKESIHDIINSSKYFQPLFFGWNTKANIIRYSNDLKPATWSFSWTNRVYWRCPIYDSKTLPQLIELINSV